MNYKPIIGIEAHIELKTESKMFCGCSAHHFRVKPNTHTCPVCLGLPGALPVPNIKAIEWCMLIGKALGCEIAEVSKFDRKNYFYPDLPKGYQISQYDCPFCKKGKLQISNTKSQTNSNFKLKTIRINRVHLEEDTAKLIHRRLKSANTSKITFIDFNRSGVALVEIVTEPDIHSADTAIKYLKKLQQIVRYLDVSDCDMEKGSMRCEVNLSLHRISNAKFLISNKIPNFKLPKYKVEIKNINSFRFVKKAIEYEIERQAKILNTGRTPLQETRGFDEKKGITYPQRQKEEALDYRYFPDPDIPPIKIKNLKFKTKRMPEMPDQIRERFIKEYGLDQYNAEILTADRNVAKYFDEVANVFKIDPRSWLDFKQIKDGLREVAKLIVNKKADINKLTPKQLIIFLKKQKKSKVIDASVLREIIKKVIKANQKAVQDYKKGKKEVIGFLIGQVMKETEGKAEALDAKKLLLEKLGGCE